ncbi:uncharacterized protein DS421_6g186180 [Arachis hypogaea]|nr:uncharacterized protein DS421_6g186180 [Arachis hypogaea]
MAAIQAELTTTIGPSAVAAAAATLGGSSSDRGPIVTLRSRFLSLCSIFTLTTATTPVPRWKQRLGGGQGGSNGDAHSPSRTISPSPRVRVQPLPRERCLSPLWRQRRRDEPLLFPLFFFLFFFLAVVGLLLSSLIFPSLCV